MSEKSYIANFTAKSAKFKLIVNLCLLIKQNMVLVTCDHLSIENKEGVDKGYATKQSLPSLAHILYARPGKGELQIYRCECDTVKGEITKY